ncbi:hypothetical protein [Burkholderia phage BCSR5]|nr:hypothetical protein [Burkholderia phage BCSR5]
MIKVHAAKRLAQSNSLQAVIEEDAAFDSSRDEVLRQFVRPLQGVGLEFVLKDNHLKCTVQEAEAIECAKRAAGVLNKMGYRLSIRPNVFQRLTFALRGVNGIVLQRISSTMLRIFFTS